VKKTRKNRKKKSFFDVVWFLIVFLVAPLFIFLASLSAPTEGSYLPSQPTTSLLPVPETPPDLFSETPTPEPQELKAIHQDYVIKLIDYWSQYYGADRNLMVNIAECESDFQPGAKNPGESATDAGVYQFIENTWQENCQGNPYNANDNVRCAAMLIARGEINHWDSSKGCWNK